MFVLIKKLFCHILAPTVLRLFLNFCKICGWLFKGVFGVPEKLQASVPLPSPPPKNQATKQVKFFAVVLTFNYRLDYGQSPQAYVNQKLQIQLELLMMSGMPLETC
jgi:hypothetical protein